MGPSPKVIEYFQSQSCSSCPPTTNNFTRLLPARAADPTAKSPATDTPISAPSRSSEHIFLSYHVPYHNHLDWTDTFAHSSFENRQHDYVKRLDLGGLYTPMVVADGVVAGTGINEGELKQLLARPSASERVRIEVDADEGDSNDQEVMISLERTAVVGDLEVFLVEYDPAVVETEVTSGENEGRVLRDWNVVRRLERIGFLSEEEDNAALLTEKKSRTTDHVVLVQEGEGGPVVGVLSL